MFSWFHERFFYDFLSPLIWRKIALRHVYQKFTLPWKIFRETFSFMTYILEYLSWHKIVWVNYYTFHTVPCSWMLVASHDDKFILGTHTNIYWNKRKCTIKWRASVSGHKISWDLPVKWRICKKKKKKKRKKIWTEKETEQTFIVISFFSLLHII